MTELITIIAAALYVVLAVAVGCGATAYERSGLAWFILAMIFSPLVAFVFLLVAGVPQRITLPAGDNLAGSPPVRMNISEDQIASSQMDCPHCGASVNVATGAGLRSPECEPWLLICNRCQSEIQPHV